MSKLYVFGIGGTGSRVIKSLTMLLASGVRMKSDAIVPIIIDPDVAAGLVNFNGGDGSLYLLYQSQLLFPV